MRGTVGSQPVRAFHSMTSLKTSSLLGFSPYEEQPLSQQRLLLCALPRKGNAGGHGQTLSSQNLAPCIH